jgi:beta-lactamase class A
MEKDQSYFPSQKPVPLKTKLPGNKKTPAEKKQTRIILIMIFGSTLVLVLLAIAYREVPSFWQKISQPRLLVSEKITPIATPTPKFNSQKQMVEEMILPLRGKYSVYFEEMESHLGFGINDKEVLTAASLIKMPVLITLFREAEAGNIDLDQTYKLQANDKRNGAGALQYKETGTEITYREMAQLMGEQSDNTAFNIISTLLGEVKIQATIDGLGMKNTSFSENLTTAFDMGLLFRKLYQEKIVTNRDRDEILTFITDTIWEDRIPAGTPKGIKVSHKIGTEVGVISDAGIVFAPQPFILVIMSQEVNEIEAKKALPEITQKIYDQVEN